MSQATRFSISVWSRRYTLLISVSRLVHLRANASPMPDVAPVIHTMLVVMTAV